MRKFVLLSLSFLCLWFQALAQKTVSGKVVDESGNPIPNATVIVKGTNVGTTTGADGSFQLSVPESGKQIIVSSVGFESTSAVIGNQSDLSFTLQSATSELAGVVVTGYTRVKKSEYVGAASKIDKSEINLVPNASFDQILQGRAPGLRVSSGSGQPGASASVQIRGPKSISGGSTPLYVIDGVPVEPSVFQSMNPNDFESVDVIKDASAAALYGSRGASGVIVITTKRGRAGKTILTYRPQFGITQPGKQRFDMLNSAELLQFQEMLGKQVDNNLPGWRYSRANPKNAGLSESQLQQYDGILDSLRGINTNWADIFQRQGSFQSHDINLSGGSDRTRFYASVGYYKEDGIGERSDLERYTARFNIDHRSDKLTFQSNTTVGYSNRDFIESEASVTLANPFAAAYLALPYHKLYNDDGTIAVGSGRVGPNAYQRIRDIERYNNQLKATSSLIARYDFTSNIYAGGSAGADFRETNTTTFVKPNTWTTSNSGFPGNSGSYGEGYNRYFQGNVRGYVGYQNDFSKVHHLDVTLYSEYILQRTKGINYTGYGISPKLPNTPAGITPGTLDNKLIPGVGGFKSERTFLSYFGTVKYSYAEKYILDLTLRRDGASVLPPQNRFQNFYAVGALWNVLKENFTQNWTAISTLRLRASYGNSANAENYPFGDFGYFPLYNAGSYGGNNTLFPSAVGNLVADWEYADKLNIGVEFGLFKDRLSGEINVYNEITRNLFIDQQNPPENGVPFLSASINAGKMRNRGIELSLRGDVVRTRDFSWTITANGAYNQNEILSLGQESEYPSGTSIVRVGLPLGTHYINEWAGVDAATGKPLYYTKDGKVTDLYSSDDQVAKFGTYFAPYTGGFTNTFQYKGLELTAFFNFQAKYSRFNNQSFFQQNHAFAISGYNLYSEMLNMWQQPGDVTDIQSPLYQRQFSSKDIQDASYLRFRNLQLAYTLPVSLLNRTHVFSACRIYLQAQNLYTWTKWTGFDPEDGDNIAQYEYPLPRIYTFGVDISF